MGTSRNFSGGGQPVLERGEQTENVLTPLRVSILRKFIVISLESSGYRNNFTKYFSILALIFGPNPGWWATDRHLACPPPPHATLMLLYSRCFRRTVSHNTLPYAALTCVYGAPPHDKVAARVEMYLYSILSKVTQQFRSTKCYRLFYRSTREVRRLYELDSTPVQLFLFGFSLTIYMYNS
jgi:hypothetical protein